MHIGRIDGATCVIGKSQGYLGLPLRHVSVNCSVGGDGTPAMESAWFPTPAEISAIVRGAPVILRVIGEKHPPVMLEVGIAPPVGEA